MKRSLLLIAASATVYAIAAWWASARLPDRDVAIHVNIAGEVDRYTDRATAIGFIVGLGCFIAVLGVVVVWLCTRIPMRHMNIPHKVYWQAPEREPVVRAMVSWDTAVLLSMTLIALTSVPVDIALLSDNPHATSPLLLLVPVGILVVAMVCYLVWMVTRRYRPPAD